MSLKVKKEKIYRKELIEKGGIQNNQKLLFREIDLDENGQLIKDVSFDQQGFIDQIVANKYNTKTMTPSSLL